MPGTLFATCFTKLNLDCEHSLEASLRPVTMVPQVVTGREIGPSE